MNLSGIKDRACYLPWLSLQREAKQIWTPRVFGGISWRQEQPAKGGNSSQPQQLSHYSNHVFSLFLLLFLFFFLPAWSSSLHSTTTAKTHEYRWALAEVGSEWNAPPLSQVCWAATPKINGFAQLIFSTRIAPLDANGGVLKPPDEGVTSAALTWLSWFLTWTMTHVTLSHGLRRWNGIHFHNKGRTWLLTCSCMLCVVKIKQDWVSQRIPVMCVHCRCQWGGNVFTVTLKKYADKSRLAEERAGEEKQCWGGNTWPHPWGSVGVARVGLRSFL